MAEVYMLFVPQLTCAASSTAQLKYNNEITFTNKLVLPILVLERCN